MSQENDFYRSLKLALDDLKVLLEDYIEGCEEAAIRASNKALKELKNRSVAGYATILIEFTGGILARSITRFLVNLVINMVFESEVLVSKASARLLSPESQAHFEEFSEMIRESEENAKVANVLIWRSLIVDMWLEDKWADKIWFPYLAKISLFVETLLVGKFSNSR